MRQAAANIGMQRTALPPPLMLSVRQPYHRAGKIATCRRLFDLWQRPDSPTRVAVAVSWGPLLAPSNMVLARTRTDDAVPRFLGPQRLDL
jgi:hypothetical protein